MIGMRRKSQKNHSQVPVMDHVMNHKEREVRQEVSNIFYHMKQEYSYSIMLHIPYCVIEISRL